MTREYAIVALAGLALAACAPGDDAGGEPSPSPETASTPTSEPAPEIFAGTAWRAVAADGARYTTFLDPDGTYRDLRNGDPWQTGSWTYSGETQGRVLCFTPSDENGVERCWEPDRMSGVNLRAESDSGATIELERVEYVLPDDADTAGADAAE